MNINHFGLNYTKNLPFIVGILISITSFLNYSQLRETIWGAELPPFILGIFVSFCLSVGIFFQKKSIPITLIDILVLSFLLYAAIHTFWGAYPWLPTDRIFYTIAILLFYILLKINFTAFLSRSNEIIVGILLGLTIQAYLGLYQHFLSPLHRISIPAVKGGYINPGIFGCSMAIALLLIIFKVKSEKKYKSKLLLIFFAGIPIFLSLLLSSSRAAWCAFILGTIILVIQYKRSSFKKYMIQYKVSVVLISALLLSFFLYFIFQLNTQSIHGRLFIWKISLQMFFDNPLWGVGDGNFFTEYSNYQAAYFSSGKGSDREILLASTNYYPFNELLGILVEHGVIGLTLFLTLLFFSLKKIFRLTPAFNTNIPFWNVLLLTIFIFGLASYPFQDLSIKSIFFLSFFYISTDYKTIYSIKPNHFRKFFLHAVTTFYLILCVQKIIAINTWRTLINVNNEDFIYEKHYEKLYKHLSNNGSFLFNYGAVLINNEDFTKGIKILNEASKYGNSIDLNDLMAFSLKKMGQKKEAEKYYIKTAYFSPKLFIPFYNLLEFYIEERELLKAKNIAAIIIAKEVKVPSKKIEEIKSKAISFLKEN